MVRVEGTYETTRNGMSGTVYKTRIIALTETDAKGRGVGKMTLRFPSNVGKVEAVRAEKLDQDETKIPGATAYIVHVFVPHNNPRNEERVY